MRLGLVPWLVLAACDPVDREARSIVFDPPVPRVVLPGDSLSAICRELGASETDVRAWNNLDGREPQVGEIVHVWRPPRAEPSLASVLRAPEPASAAPARGERRVAGRSRRAAAPTRAAAVTAPRVNLRDWVLTPTQLAFPAAAPAPARAVALDVEATRVHGTGVLGSARDDDEGLADLELDLEGWSARRSAVGATSLNARGGALAERGAAEGLGEVAATRVLGRPTSGDGRYVADGPARPPALAMPAAKRCLTTSTAVDLGDDGIGGSRGLAASQVRAGFTAFARHTAACLPAGSTGTWSASFGVTIGCDGRVSEAWTLDDGGLPDRVTRCVEATLRFAAFPAHDMPAGVDVTWPVTWRR